MAHHDHRHQAVISRRALLRISARLALPLAPLPLLAACGGPATTSVTTSSQAVVATSARAQTAVATVAATSTSTSAPVPAAAAPAGSAITLHYSFYASDPETVIYKQLTDDFHVQTPDITVVPDHVVGVDYFEKMKTLLSAGTPPDVMMFTTKELKGFIIQNAFRALDALQQQSVTYKQADIFPVEWAKNVFKGKLWAVPLTHSPAVIYYQKDLFDKLHVPYPPSSWDDASWTWDAHLQRARQLTTPAGGSPTFGHDNGTSWWFVQPFIWSNNDDYLSADSTQVQIDHAAVVAAFQWVADFRNKSKVMPSPSDKVGDTTTAFINARIGMFMAITSTAPTLLAHPGLNFNVAPLPHHTAQSWTRNPQLNVTISGITKYPQQSWRWIEHLAGEPGQRALAQLHRGLPAMIKVAQSPDWLTPGATADWKVFLDAALQHSHPEHEIVRFEDLNKMLGDAYQKILSGAQTAAEMAQAIKGPLETLIAANTVATQA